MSYLKYHELSFCIVKHLSELISIYYKASKPDLLGVDVWSMYDEEGYILC